MGIDCSEAANPHQRIDLSEVRFYGGTYCEACNHRFALSRELCLYLGSMSRWKKLVIVFIALWLPLQGYGAVAMPFCDHGPAMPDSFAAVSAQADAHEGDRGHSVNPAHDHAANHDSTSLDKSSHEQAGLGCSDCGPCQLACAPLIFSGVPHITSTGSPVYDPTPVASLTSISPEQIQRPPLPAFV